MATIKDVARDAGVAPSTVSYVLTGSKKLPQATVDRVLQAAERLQYRPSPAARALAMGGTKILGYLATVSPTSHKTDIDVFMRFVRSAMYAARKRGYDVLVMGRGSDELVGEIVADALLVMDIRRDDERLPDLVQRGISTVLIGLPEETYGLSAVDLDFEKTARLSVDYLADLGHKEIAVLASPAQAFGRELSFHYRFRRAFVDECARQGVRGVALDSGDTVEEVQQWLRSVKEELPGLSAIVLTGVAATDSLLRVLEDNEIEIPRDVSVLALAPEEEFKATYPGFTLIDLPGSQMVEIAVNMALDELEGASRGTVVLLEPRIVEGTSVVEKK